MKFRIVSLCLFFAFRVGISQNIDSLLLKLYQESNDRSRIEILLNISSFYDQHDRNFIQAENYLYEALQIAQTAGDNTLLANTYNELGKFYRNQSKYPEALKYHHLADSLAVKMGDCILQATTLNNIGVVYRRLDNHAQASEYHLRALNIAEGCKDTFNISVACNSLGNIFSLNGRYQQALSYFNRALALSISQNNLLGQAMNFNNIGEVYEFMGDYRNAKYYYTKSLDINFKLKNLKGISINYNALGKIEMFNGNPENAYRLFQNALDIDRKLGDKKFLADSYVNLAKACLALKKIDKAKIYLDSTITIAQQIGSPWHLQSAYEAYSDYFVQKSDYLSALLSYKNASRFKDSLLNEKNARHLSTIQTIYETEKKEKEISYLLQEQALKQKELEKNNAQKNALIIGLVLSSLVVIVSLFAWRTKVKSNIVLSDQIKEIEDKNRLLEIQKEEIEQQKIKIESNQAFIEQKNKNLEEAHKIIESYIENITDSIRYAEKIHESIQPSLSDMLSIFLDAFIYSKPKDIVSGDFCWLTRRDNLVFLALADCTGHGVPGAFMSTIGINILNQAINEQHLYSPDKILTFINRTLINRLNKSTGEQVLKNSMDIAVCTFDTESLLLSYSGALIPIFIQKGNSVEEVKPDSITLGTNFSHSASGFSLQNIQLNHGDWVYLSSDGFFDQLGGESRKKFTRKQFMQIAADSPNMKGNVKVDIIEKKFLQWMNRTPQLDDVLVWGFQV